MQPSAVDPHRHRLDDRATDGAGADPLEGSLSLQLRQELGIRDAVEVEVLRKDHRRRDERSGEGASSDLVDTGDQPEAVLAEPSLVVAEIRS
jgi:hypothetical protein